MKTIKDAVIELSGKFPDSSGKCAFLYKSFTGLLYAGDGSSGDGIVCTRSEFESTAKRMGYINGYRYGVEYPTNGKRPDLPDDIGIKFCVPMCIAAFSVIAPSALYAAKGATFMITDERYKPADTSYLDKHDSSLDSDAGWFDHDMHKAVSPAPIRTEVIVDCFDKGWKDAVVIGAFDRWNWLDINGGGLQTVDICRIKPLDHATRKAEAEKKRVVAAAQKECVNFSSNDLGRLYDAGLLRLPDQK